MSIKFTERDVEDYVFENPGVMKQVFPITNIEWIGKQFILPSGILDLLGKMDNGHAIVVELKNVRASHSSVTQVLRYMSDLQLAVDLASYGTERRLFVHPVIIAPRFDKSIYKISECLGINLFEFSFDGVDFELNEVGMSRDTRSRTSDNHHILTNDEIIRDLIESHDSIRGVTFSDVHKQVCDFMQDIEL